MKERGSRPRRSKNFKRRYSKTVSFLRSRRKMKYLLIWLSLIRDKRDKLKSRPYPLSARKKKPKRKKYT